MNSKKKIAVLGLTVLISFVFAIVKAQQPIVYSNNTFSITTPPIPIPARFANKTPYTNVFFETGTGNFFTYSTKDRQTPFEQQIFTQPWDYIKNPSNRIQTVVQLATSYDTTIKPHSFSYYVANAAKGTNSQNQRLQPGEKIKITTAIDGTIIPADTMTLALTYKSLNSSSLSGASSSCATCNKSVIAFFYNSPENSNLFKQIPTDDTKYNFAGGSVTPIRKYNEESLTTIGSLPAAIKSILEQVGGGGQGTQGMQGVYFTASYNISLGERNIFLSLVTNTSASLSDEQVRFGGLIKVVLIDYDSTNPACNNITSIDKKFDINRLSRDPNYITTTPNCLETLTSPYEQTIKYTIHFENIGEGAADSIKVDVFIPEGIEFLKSGSRMYITCSLGNIKNVPVAENSRKLLAEKNKRWCLYSFDPLKRKISFKIINASLTGMQGRKMRNNIGEISFRLKTEKRRNPDVPTLIPDCMYSFVSIIFDDNLPERDGCLITRNCIRSKSNCPLPAVNMDTKRIGD
jgi:uncharacterized repeat protein (TIGR01451 family)